MAIWIRQVATVTSDLETVEAQFAAVFDEGVVHRDPKGMAYLGLDNAVMSIGDDFFESVSPHREGTIAESFLKKQGGDSGYMLSLQTDEFGPYFERVKALGLRHIIAPNKVNFDEVQIHPADIKGTYLGICEQIAEPEVLARGFWSPAGDEWRELRSMTRITDILGAEMQTKDPEAVAEIWSKVLDLPIERGKNDAPCLQLKESYVRFVTRPEGEADRMVAVDIKATDPKVILDAAKANNVPNNGIDQVAIGGMNFNLV